MSSDEDLFAQQMADVTPVEVKPRVDLKTGVGKSTPGEKRRRQAAVSSEEKPTDNYLTANHIPPVEPLAVLAFQREGVQHGVYRKLKRGNYELEATIDLHNMTVEQARVELFDFIHQCLEYDVRTALVTHGKGDRNLDNPGILKSCTALWLKEVTEVIAFHSAQPRHGGVGSVYVMLKKSKAAKEQNSKNYRPD
ncbi:putative DNA endonuclease SmrA [Sinobacterium norvegicum]|uniref:DNA endonuclease SmrA n=1 Tax=Sinobacterium norvegicum TaxID=1641715 RepID=A0ABM9AHN1_9GAMM|nr:DNA endonuclease SmrA [Sinobacterium norvegicum]CAH0992705.1 putative DNA endonuclease SmrA [Sinobacterium norvegicum]